MIKKLELPKEQLAKHIREYLTTKIDRAGPEKS